MRTAIISVLSLFVSGCLCASDTINDDYRNAIRNGAMACYVYRVVDDVGTPVAGADAHVWFRSYGRPKDNKDWGLVSGTNGMVEVSHRVNEHFCISVEKEGYYSAYDHVYYLQDGHPEAVDDKWVPYGQVRDIVLKPIREPHVMLGPMRTEQRSISVYDEWIGFDLERCDFLPPMGEGKDSDMMVRFRRARHAPNEWTKTMDVCFTNYPCAGAYRLKKDACSDMKSVYCADTNAAYQSVFSFCYKVSGGKQVLNDILKEDEYLVFRTRTKVDDEGNLISARYGKIYGPWHFEDAGGSRISRVFMNEKENDVNLEDRATLDLLKRTVR